MKPMDAEASSNARLMVALIGISIAGIAWALHANAVRDRAQAGARARCEAIHDLWDHRNGVCLQVIRP